jgi:hypothetical protein
MFRSNPQFIYICCYKGEWVEEKIRSHLPYERVGKSRYPAQQFLGCLEARWKDQPICHVRFPAEDVVQCTELQVRELR